MCHVTMECTCSLICCTFDLVVDVSDLYMYFVVRLGGCWQWNVVWPVVHTCIHEHVLCGTITFSMHRYVTLQWDIVVWPVYIYICICICIYIHVYDAHDVHVPTCLACFGTKKWCDFHAHLILETILSGDYGLWITLSE